MWLFSIGYILRKMVCPFRFTLSPSLHLYLKSVQEVSSKRNSENETPLFFSDTWSPTITSWPVTVKHAASMLCTCIFFYIYIYTYIRFYRGFEV